jgi:hypothetical protein
MYSSGSNFNMFISLSLYMRVAYIEYMQPAYTSLLIFLILKIFLTVVGARASENRSAGRCQTDQEKRRKSQLRLLRFRN